MTDITCPNCRTRYPLAAGLTESEAGQAVAAALEFAPAPLRRLLLPYFGLFRPVSRGTSWERIERLLRELAELIDGAEVARNGVTRVAPYELWLRGLEAVLAKRDAGSLKLPLGSPRDPHALLKQIVWDEAGAIQGAIERKKEQQLARGGEPRRGAAAVGKHLEGLRQALNRREPTTPEDAT